MKKKITNKETKYFWTTRDKFAMRQVINGRRDKVFRENRVPDHLCDELLDVVITKFEAGEETFDVVKLIAGSRPEAVSYMQEAEYLSISKMRYLGDSRGRHHCLLRKACLGQNCDVLPNYNPDPAEYFHEASLEKDAFERELGDYWGLTLPDMNTEEICFDLQFCTPDDEAEYIAFLEEWYNEE